MKKNVSVYRNAKDKKGVVVPINAVVTRIQNGGKGLDEKTRIANKLAVGNPKVYREFKELELPAVTWSGTFTQRKGENLSIHSGLACLDAEDCDAPSIMAVLAQRPDVFLAFISPSGISLKIVVPLDPIPKDRFEHKIAYAAVKEAFSDLDCSFDPTNDVNRLCFLAHDPLLIHHPNATATAWDPTDEALAGEGVPPKQPHNVSSANVTDASKVLSFLDPDCDYETWLKVGMGCHAGGVPFTVWDAWSAKGSKYNASEMPSKWDSFKGSGITWGTVVHLAKEKGYKPPRYRRKPVKLQKNVVSMLTETLDKSRDFLQSVFSNKNVKFFGLRADTGVGKNETAIAFFLKGFGGLVNIPTTDLAKELQVRFDNAEIDAFRYRGILSNPDGEFPDESPCIHAVRYDAIASRGWNAYELLCESCEAHVMCADRGYRSQASQAKQSQVTLMPFPDIFMNPAFRSLAKDFLPTYSNDMILHDEFDPYNAFLQIDVPKSRLVQLRDDWKGYDPSHFAKELLRILEVEGDLSLMRPFVERLTPAERETIIEGLTCVFYDGQILSRSDAHRCDFYRAKMYNTDEILTLPRLESEDWNLLVQLELFFERYPRDADMPMKYENDTLTFMLPPLPMKTRARMGFMSATLDESFFRRCFDNRQEKRGDVSFHDTGLTAWHPEATVFQLRTNRNPRATAYTPKGVRVDGELLSATGEFYWSLVADDLKNENRGLITYKAQLENRASELEGIPTANFGGLVGLDTHFKDVEVLHILFSPELPLSEVDFKAKTLFGNDTEPLCYDRDENGHYIDVRLQDCYSDGVISELLQAIGRGRLVSKPIKVVVWCSHFLPGVTDREQTLLFDEVDWQETDGDIPKLADVIKARENAEQNGDVQAYAEATGQSKSTAYRQTKETRRQTKTERDKEIHRRYANGAGETQQEIATALAIGLATVNRVLNR